VKIFNLLLPLLISCSSIQTTDNKLLSRPHAEKLCFVGDTGTGEKEQYEVARAMEKANCDAVFIAGDIIYPIGIWSKKSNAFKKKFLRPFESLRQKSEIFLALGNHDYYGRQSLYLEIVKPFKNVQFPNYFYQVVTKSACIFVLDTNKGLDEQVDWLRVVKNDYPCPKTILVGHHPYLSQGEHGDATGKRKDFYEEILQLNFDAVVAGHDHHLSYEGKTKNTHHFITGAGAKLRDFDQVREKTWGVSKLGFLVYDGSWAFFGINNEELWRLYE